MSKAKVAIVYESDGENSTKFLAEILRDRLALADLFVMRKSVDYAPLDFSCGIRKSEALDLSGYEKVLSLSNGVAHGVVTNLDTLHVNLQIGFGNGLWETDGGIFTQFAKYRHRIWQQASLKRPQKNLVLSEYMQKYFLKLSGESASKIDIFDFKSSERKERLDAFACFHERQNRFLSEVVSLFNKTGKGVNYFSPAVIDRENFCKFRGLILTDSQADILKVARLITHATPLFSLKQGVVPEFYPDDMVYTFGDLDNFEDAFAKFISWSKKFFDEKVKIPVVNEEKFLKAVTNALEL